MEKGKKQLSDSDAWFYNNLQAIIKAQKALVEQGKQKKIDRSKIASWIKNNG